MKKANKEELNNTVGGEGGFPHKIDDPDNHTCSDFSFDDFKGPRVCRNCCYLNHNYHGPGDGCDRMDPYAQQY